MSDIVLTLRQAEDFFQRLTLQLLGVPANAPKKDSRVRIGWPEKGAPAWKQNEDVTFLLLTYDDDMITQQQHVTYQPNGLDSINRTVEYTRVLRVNWICYGPNSFDDADKIRSGLYLPPSSEALIKSNMALIMDVPSPMRSPELFNGQWWDRSSFYARFNEKVTRRSEIPTLKSADIQIVEG